MTASTSTSAELDADGLLDLLRRQRDLYDQLDALSAGQLQLIEQGTTEALLSLLAERQGVVDQLGAINAQLAPARDRWEQWSANLSDEDRDEVRALLGHVDACIKAIVHRDDEAQRQLTQAQQTVGAELRQVTATGTALGAYHAAPQRNDARFTDRKG